MSEAIIAKRSQLTQQLKMKAAVSIVVVDARGLTVEQDTVLRREGFVEAKLSIKLCINLTSCS